MAKGYWIGHGDVTDVETYKKYQAANAAAFKKYGARFVVRGGAGELAEGNLRSRHVVIEFPSYQAAIDCYRSELYQSAKALRLPVSSLDLMIVEGYDGPQPGDG
jgi:uncharacterized protein (DUF1330 family)